MAFISEAVLGSGCGFHLNYLSQAARGQFVLSNRAKPITDVIRDERVSPRVRSLLKEIDGIKKFGEARGLKPTSNYTDYVKLDHRVVVWVVSACEILQFRAKEWSFPIVGKFPYLGWFDRSNAIAYADTLKSEGWESDVRGARAYSTLGWFRDSVLSSMIPDGQEALGEIADVILHESVHATIYIKGHAVFNESLAEFAGEKMALEYLEETRGNQSTEKTAYLQVREESRKAEAELHQAYTVLDQLYRSQKSDSEKLAEKEKILGELNRKMMRERKINNATLLQYKTYHSGNDALEKLFVQAGRDWKTFLSLARNLAPEQIALVENKMDSTPD